jgi:hypothetical protein
MKYVKSWLVLLFLGLALAAPGCKRSAPPPADPDKGREVLKTTLDAWQKGESADSLRQRSPSITAADSKWQGGHQLVRYEIGESRIVGGELQCNVVLVLKAPNGKQSEQKAIFNVSTSPKLVVVRGEG